MESNQPDRKELQNVFEQTPVALAMLSGPEHVFTFANPTFRSLFSLPDDCIGQTTRALFPGADQQGFIALMNQVFTTGNNFVSHGTPFEQLQKDGRRRLFFLDIVYEPSRDVNGEVIGLIASANDVTDAVTARQALEQNQAQLNLVLENAKFGTWSVDLKTNLVTTSRKLEQIFGLPVGGAVFEAIAKSMHPDDQAEVDRRFQEASITGDPYEHEYRIVRPNGEIRWILSKGIMARDAHGTPAVFSGILEDITETKLANEKLAEQFRRFDALISNLPDILGIFDAQGKYLYMNRAGLALAQTTLPEVIGRTPTDVPAFRGKIAAEFEKALGAAAQQKRIVLEQFSIVTATGVRHFDYVVAPILTESGEIEGLVASGRDVSKLRENEARLERSERLLRSAVGVARIGYFDWDVKNDVMILSERMKFDWGVDDTATGATIRDLIHPDDLDRVMELSNRAMTENTIFETEYRVLRPDGRLVWIKAHGEFFYEADGTPMVLVGTSVDITSEKNFQQQLQTAKVAAENANQAKSAFLANMSHEIRTPLGAILGFAELLKDANLGASERAQYLEIIGRNGHSLARVIDDVLDLSKVEAGRLQVELASVSVAEIVEDVRVLFSDKVRQKRIELLTFCSDQVPFRVMTDAARLRQILINIVGNAVKFTDFGMIMIAVEATQIPAGSWKYEISVKDSGRGLTAEQADSLFEPFVQADASTTRKYGGTGLGLALSRRLARALGGDVFITESELGKGSTFMISFCAEEPKILAQAPPEMRPIMIEGRRILLIEDSVDNQKLVKKILLVAGAFIETADDGHDGIRRALEGDLDLVLLDIQMPGMDGYQVLAELQKRGFRKPVVALTAHAMAEERVKTNAAGFAAHVTKPIDRAELLATIARLTNQSAS